MAEKFDAIVIGTGQSGPLLAELMAREGLRVAVIERGKFGGTCVNTGCVPTKTLVASAYVAHMAAGAPYSVIQRTAHIHPTVAEYLPAMLEDSFSSSGLQVSDYGAKPPEAVELQNLREAVRGERKLLITYRDSNEQETTRVVLPVAIFYYVEVVVLAARCQLRSDFRHFRTDRIVNCSETGENFKSIGKDLRVAWLSQHERF